MAQIDHASQLAALIRAQIGAQFRAQQGRGGVAGRKADQDAPPGSETSRREAGLASDDGTAVSLRQLVAQRVRALSPDDPQRQRKAFRIFLESVLLEEFGRDRLGDPGFDRLIDQVLQQMEADPELQAAVRQAGDLLLADA